QEVGAVQRQLARRLELDGSAVDVNALGDGVDSDFGRRGVPDHVALAQATAAPYPLDSTRPARGGALEADLARVDGRQRRRPTAGRPPLAAVDEGLAEPRRGAARAQRSPDAEARLDHHLRLRSEERRPP